MAPKASPSGIEARSSVRPEQIGDKTSTVLDVSTHIICEWRQRSALTRRKRFGERACTSVHKEPLMEDLVRGTTSSVTDR